MAAVEEDHSAKNAELIADEKQLLGKLKEFDIGNLDDQQHPSQKLPLIFSNEEEDVENNLPAEKDVSAKIKVGESSEKKPLPASEEEDEDSESWIFSEDEEEDDEDAATKAPSYRRAAEPTSIQSQDSEVRDFEYSSDLSFSSFEV
jgi:hypothetical protein